MASNFKFTILSILFSLNCVAEDLAKQSQEALITRYVSVLNAISGQKALPDNEIKRELLLSLMINYYYVKDQQEDLSRNFKIITKSIGKKLNGFDFKIELDNYVNLIQSLDEDTAVLRLTLDGFKKDTAMLIVEKSKRNDFKDLVDWVSKNENQSRPK